MDTKSKKKLLRKKLLNLRATYDKDESKIKSSVIFDKVLSHPLFRRAQNVLFYVPIKNEVDTINLINEALKTKSVYLPKTKINGEISVHKISGLEDTSEGKYGIPEPTTAETDSQILDLIIVPGVAFDSDFNRIGFGKGYYDKFLKKLKCPKIALAYDFQIIKNIPAQEHDQKIDIIITNSKIYEQSSN
ncbi:5-formyltetrahydrofolate cyclo-ligase [Candidatus Peregrinibacteria bacterium]|nr:5-formyltetrahydrofolate cyclo-ligase [Candidatus Peregrinibacteria bacterium]